MPRIFILLIFCLASCSSKAYQAYPKPAGVLLDDVATSLQLQKFQSYEVPETAKFLLNVSLRYGKDFNSFRQGLIFKAPNKFRVETYPLQAGWASNYFISDGEKYVYYDSQNNNEQIGLFNESLFEEFYNIPITLDEILSLLIGRTPKRWLLSKNSIFAIENNFAMNSKDKKYFWHLSNDGSLLDFLIYKDSSNKVILKGKVISYSKDNLETTIPKAIQLDVPEHDVRIIIRTSQAQLNHEIPTENFIIN